MFDDFTHVFNIVMASHEFTYVHLGFVLKCALLTCYDPQQHGMSLFTNFFTCTIQAVVICEYLLGLEASSRKSLYY